MKAYNFTKARLTEGWDVRRIIDALHSGEYLERRVYRKGGIRLTVDGKSIRVTEFLKLELGGKKHEHSKAYCFIRNRIGLPDEQIVTEFRKKFKTSG